MCFGYKCKCIDTDNNTFCKGEIAYINCFQDSLKLYVSLFIVFVNSIAYYIFINLHTQPLLNNVTNSYYKPLSFICIIFFWVANTE